MDSSRYDRAIQADHLYVTGQDSALVELARDLWPHGDDAVPSHIGDIFRLAKLACLRQATALPPGDPAAMALLADMHLFEAHSMTAAALDGDAHVIAGLLLPRFFALIKTGHFDMARLVLDDMARLVVDESEQLPWAAALRRLIAEKRGYSYFVEGRYQDSIACYSAAVAFIKPKAVRSLLKVRGGIALATFMDSARSPVDVDALRLELSEVAAAAEVEPAPDVVGWASENLKLIDANRLGEWVPFEAP